MLRSARYPTRRQTAMSAETGALALGGQQACASGRNSLNSVSIQIMRRIRIGGDKCGFVAESADHERFG